MALAYSAVPGTVLEEKVASLPNKRNKLNTKTSFVPSNYFLFLNCFFVREGPDSWKANLKAPAKDNRIQTTVRKLPC